MVQSIKKSNTGKSPSDLAGRKPTTRKGAAGGASVLGAALAATFIQNAMNQAEAVEKMGMTLKEELAELVLLEHAQHGDFRKIVREKQASYAAEAVSTGNENITKYRAANQRVNYVYAQLSDWHTLSEAIEVGYKPDMAKGWAEIKGNAVAYIDDNNRRKAIAENETAKTLQQQRETVMKDTKLSVEKRQEEAAKIDGQINELIKAKFTPRARVSRRKPTATTATTTPTTQAAPLTEGADTAGVKIKQITTMLMGETVPVILGVAAFLETFLKSEEFKKRETAAKALDQQKKDEANKDKGVRATPAGRGEPGVPSESKPTNEREPAATAKAPRRSRK